MQLSEIVIDNFRSIESVEFPILAINDSNTYALLGINESGKSSFLTAVHLIKEREIKYPEDYFHQKKPVTVMFKYKVENEWLKEVLIQEFGYTDSMLQVMRVEYLYVISEYLPNAAHTFSTRISIDGSLGEMRGFEIGEKGQIIKSSDPERVYDLKELLELHLKEFIVDRIHKVVFWRSSKEYLLLDEINLLSFASRPYDTSVPLVNCFRLAGYNAEEIKPCVEKLSTAAAINNLQEKLSDKVTEHIKKVWPEHPVSIRFQISNGNISFLVEDDGVKYLVKTPGQRSDGFRQFISFLLTVSIENEHKELTNTILLIDEPEVHLHPPAQLNLLRELINVTSNNRGNIVVFATHSNYLIDKDDIDRCFKVSKEGNERTTLSRISKGYSSYAEVNYEVFGIPTNDYHNELYGFIEDVSPEKINELEEDRSWCNTKNGKKEQVSMSRYIRHSIHHPENKKNAMFTESELKESIQILRALKDTIDG